MIVTSYTRKQFFKNGVLLALIVSLLLSPLLFDKAAHSSVRPGVDIREAYLSHYFGIDWDNLRTEKQFLTAADKIIRSHDVTPLSADKPLSALRAIRYGLKLAGFKELVPTYSDRNVEETLDHDRQALLLDKNELQEAAAAVDIGMILSSDLDILLKDTPAQRDLVARVLLFVADAKGKGRNFLGTTDQPDIYGRILSNYREGLGMMDPKLYTVGKRAVKRKITTGFNLKNDRYAPRFFPDLTLTYSHSSIDHVKQLIALMKREGIVAKVQLEPKLSIYEYLLEWGAIPKPSPTYRVENHEENFYLAHSYEYDLSFEFATAKDKSRFDALIKKFAKKNSADPKDKPLLIDSWWQPLYSSPTPMNAEDYHLIYDNVLTHNHFSIHPFSLAEKKDETAAQLQALAPDRSVDSRPIYVNSAFYRYLKGESE